MHAPGRAGPPGERPAVNVLVVDDNARDAELSVMALRRARMLAEFHVASDEQQLRSVLRTFVPDVVLCDFALPDFSGSAAMRVVREFLPETPVIFVSGAISESLAVDLVHSGAADYVPKTMLLRLPNAVQRAVEAARERLRFRVALQAAEDRMRQHAERLESLWRIAVNPGLRGDELVHAMLDQAVIAIRPDQRFRALLGRIDETAVEVIGIGLDPGDESLYDNAPRVGTRTPLERTLISLVARTGYWDDLASLNPIPGLVAQLGWRAAISTQFEAGGSRYSLTLASLEPTTMAFGPEDIAYVEVLGSSFAKQLQVEQLEGSLRDAEERARQHAERLESLLKIVNNSVPRDRKLWMTVLAQAAAAMLPGQDSRGMLARIDGSEMVVEAVVDTAELGPLSSDPLHGVGGRIPLEGTFFGKMLADGVRTRSCDDLKMLEEGQARARALGFRAAVFTTFSAGSSAWTLAFLSREPARRPFGEQERAYVELLASFFANHVQQGWQFDRIAYQESHDELTGLINRSEFRSQARAASAADARYAVIEVDVNAFGEINESYGHVTGDALLREVGKALKRRAAVGELVGRFGGDVFGVFLPNPVSREFVRGRALDFAEVFARSFSTGGLEGRESVSLTASLGIAVAPEDGRKLDAVMSHADAALSSAKQRGHGSIAFYEAGMEGDAQANATLRNDITQALAENQFTLYYQPHVEIESGAVSGGEALIRWNHPTRGFLPPGQFIPFAERSGMVTSIDAWVMRNALTAAAELGVLQPGFRLYFNLSGRQVSDPALITAFMEAARHGAALGNIGVEITETDAMRDIDATRRVCHALRALGVRIAIDDFGTGYSSLSSLKQLPVDIVKVDRSFVAGVLTDPHDATIAETIIQITERFGFESLAEGAEEPEQIEWLRRHACRYVQGYAISYPLPLDAFRAWLLAHESASALPV